MPRTKSYNETEVLERAMELFWQKGFHATSIQDLVSHLGVHRGSLYGQFGDKKQLFDASLLHYRKINTEKIKDLLSKQTSIKEGFRNLLYNAVEDNQHDNDKKGCFMVNAATELASQDPEIKTILKGNHETLTQLFADFIENGQQKGQIDKSKNPNHIANLIFTFFCGIVVIGKIQNHKEDILSSIDTILKIL